jgi:MacB-like periplasmic core domain
MNWIKRLFSRRRLHSDLSDEIREHLAEKIEELVASGMSREEAIYAARREFGNATLIEERGREVWQWHLVEDFLQDLRYGLRQLRRSPVFTSVAVITLALAIGANTAIFSVINALMLRMLPVHNPQELVQVAYQEQRRNQMFVGQALSYPLFKDLRDGNNVLTDMAAVAPWPLTVSLGDNGSHKPGAAAVDVAAQPPNSRGQLVSANFFSVLGFSSVAGRFFDPSEDKGVHPVVVISYAFWTRAFTRDPRAIGRTLRLGGLPFTIVGVAPAHFSGLDPGQAFDLWVPISMQPQVNAGCECGHLTNPHVDWVTVVGRVKPGVSEALARAGLDVLFQRALRQRDVSTWSEQERRDFFTQHIILLPAAHGTDYLRQEFSRPLFLLMGAVSDCYSSESQTRNSRNERRAAGMSLSSLRATRLSATKTWTLT